MGLTDDVIALTIMLIAIMDYVELPFLRSQTAAHDGVVGFACLDSRLGGNGCGVFVPLRSGVGHEVDDIGIMESCRGCSFDPVTALVCNRRSSKIGCPCIELVWHWYPYWFSVRHFYDVPERRMSSTKRYSYCVPVPRSDEDPVVAVHLRVCHQIRSCNANVVVFDAYVRVSTMFLQFKGKVVWPGLLRTTKNANCAGYFFTEKD